MRGHPGANALPWEIAWRYLRGRRSRLLDSTARAAILATGIGVLAMVIPMALMLAWTIFSGAEYFWKAWPLLGGKLAPEPKPAAAPPQKSPLK